VKGASEPSFPVGTWARRIRSRSNQCAGTVCPELPVFVVLVTLDDDHGTLPAHADRLLRVLASIENWTVEGNVGHLQHMEHAKRLRQLAHHLRAVLQLNDTHHYPSALVIVRAALEHHLMDRLILLANRHIVTYTKAKKADAARWEADIVSLQARGSDIAGWFWDQAGLNVVHRGLHSVRSTKGRGQTISSWYFEADRFDPFAGPKRHAGRLASPFWEKRLLQQLADALPRRMRCAGDIVVATLVAIEADQVERHSRALPDLTLRSRIRGRARTLWVTLQNLYSPVRIRSSPPDFKPETGSEGPVSLSPRRGSISQARAVPTIPNATAMTIASSID
jgi:hypothetical protein